MRSSWSRRGPRSATSATAARAAASARRFGPASAEADRPTMDAAARDAHDAALRAFVFALAPVGGRFEAHVILDYLARTADLLEACPAGAAAARAALRRVAVGGARLLPLRPREPAAAAQWAFAVPAAKEAERGAAAPVALPAALFGNACAADAAFAEDVAGHAVACAGAAADAVEALTNGAAADLPGPLRRYSRSPRSLSRGARGRDGKLARRLLPKASALLDTRGPCAPDARACAEAVLLALCGQGSLSDDASDAAAASVIDASLRTGALEKRSLAVALTVAASKSCRARGAAGALPRAALLKLADLAASDDGDAAFRVLETAFLGAGAPHAALALRSVARQRRRVAAVVAAAARACGSGVLAGVLADDARLGALLEGDRSPARRCASSTAAPGVAAAIRDLAAAPGDDAASALAALAAGPGAWDHLRLVFGHTSLRARGAARRAASFLAASFLAAKLGGGDGGDDDGAAARVCLAALGAAGAEAPAGDDYARQAWARRRRRRAVVLGALAGAPEPALRRCFSDAERTQLFAALLALLRRDGAAPPRTGRRRVRRGRGPEERLAPRLGGGPAPARGRGARGRLRRALGRVGGARRARRRLAAAARRDAKLRAAAAWATLRAVLAAARGLLEGDGAHSIAAADVAGDVAFADAAAAAAHWARALGAARGRASARAARRRGAGGAAPAALFDAALAPAEADDDPSLLRAVADALGSAGPAAVALACLGGGADRGPRARARRRGRPGQALGHVARSCRPLLVAARADEAFDGAESGAFLEPCFAAGAAAAPVAVRDVARSPGAALSLVAVAAGFVRKRVLKLSHEPELAAGRHRGRKRRRNGDDADRLAAQRFRLVLCQELSGGLGLVPGDPARDDDDAARPRAFSTASRPDDDDAWPAGEAPCGARHFAHAGRALGRALKRALGLLDAPGLLSFVEKVLSRPCPTRARDATTRALDERLDRERPLRCRASRAVSGVEHPLEDTADARHASLVAAKMADVLARALAESCRGDDGARFEVLVEAACAALPPACDGAAVEAYGPERPAAVFALVQTLLATLRDAALPALGAGLPRCLDAVDALPRLLRIAVDAAAAGDDGESEPYELAAAPGGARRARGGSAGRAPRGRGRGGPQDRRRARAGRRAARPPAGRRRAPTRRGRRAAAAALRVALPCVARMGRGAAKAHAATVASSRSAPSTTARLGGAVQGAVDAAATELSLALLSKLGDAELVDWLRAAAAWAAAAPDAAAPAAVATLATRFREIAAPRCLDACYDQCVRDMACPAEARAGKKKRKRADAAAAARGGC
ncbi:hypothetical protein JL720_9515 [Aureococcus anophagefferens]|nr:hypothetical protein JL720_9515 [Aureococcus anophagefferens]